MSTEIQHVTDVERIPRETDTALSRTASQSIERGPAWALARLSDEEFELVTAMAVKGRERLQTVMRSMMRPATHYGEIPGTTKPGEKPKLNLLKPGGEVLRQMFRLVAEPIVNIIYGDGETAPRVTVECRTLIHMDTIDGPVVAVGVGACTSWERKYRYRRGDRLCPECGKATIRRSTFPDKITGVKGWYCYAKVGGCSAQFGATDQAIVEQQIGEVENPDQLDQLNTIVKMAKKRSVIDATIEATASSDLLTQDMEDTEAAEQGSETRAASVPARDPVPPRARTASAAKATSAAITHAMDDAPPFGDPAPPVKPNGPPPMDIAEQLTLSIFYATCEKAAKMTGRSFIKKPSGTEDTWFVDQLTIDATRIADERLESVHIQRGKGQVVSQERLARLHAGVTDVLAAGKARTE